MSYIPQNEDPSTGAKQDEIIAGIDETKTETIVSVKDSDGTTIDPSTKQFQAEQKFLLGEIIQQLKMMNFLLKQMSDIDIDERSIDNDDE